MSLDANERPPHLTLLNVECEEVIAKAWWEKVKANATHHLTVTLTGLMFFPLKRVDLDVPVSGIYCGLEARNTQVLRDAHNCVLDLAKDTQPLGLIADDRSPHITLGFLTAFPASAKLPEDLLGTTFEGRMAFGRVGPYGTFPEFFERL